MTTTTKSVMFRLQDDNPAAFDAIQRTVAQLALAGIAIQDPTTQFDYNRAVEQMMDALEPPSEWLQHQLKGFPTQVRPESMDIRPLYRQLDDQPADLAQLLRQQVRRLNVAGCLIDSESLRRDYCTATETFFKALGIPSERQFAENPENYPGIVPK